MGSPGLLESSPLWDGPKPQPAFPISCPMYGGMVETGAALPGPG